MAATLLDPICSHLLTRFTSSPHTVELGDDKGGDNALRAITITGEGAPYYFDCGFVGSSLAIAVYRALFQPEARATLKKCVLEVGPGQFNEQFGCRELLEDMVGLRELQVCGFSIGLKDILTPLSEQIPSSSSRAMWLCPQLRRLELTGMSFDIADLWKLIDARYGGDDPPTPSVQLIVEENTYHGDLNEVPIGTAVKVSDLLGSKNFLWDGWTPKGNPEWE
ncbi:hypothetical protein FRC03_000403 [Tulasnella sp. 419]|nr:hypothetical protein FRC03_000403 [Tulasnella sp. 419]